MLVILKVKGQTCLARVPKASRDSLRNEQPGTDIHCSIHINELQHHECMCVCVFSQDVDIVPDLCFSQEEVQGMATRITFTYNLHTSGFLQSQDINIAETADLTPVQTACEMSFIIFVFDSLYQDPISNKLHFCRTLKVCHF